MKIYFERIEHVLPQNTFFIHGNLASHRWWYPILAEWKLRNQNKPLDGSMILGDFRGCGKSPIPSSAADVQMKLLARDFIEVIESQSMGPVHLVGHSTGGLIAVLMLSMRPDLFDRAVLLDPVGPYGVHFDPSMTQTFDSMKLDKDLVATVMQGTIYKCDPHSEFFRNVVVEDAYRAVQNVGVWILQVLDGLRIDKEASIVKNEVLVLHGEHDQLLPIEDSKAYLDYISNAQFKMLDGQGHCMNVENPKGLIDIIDPFLFRK